MVKDTDLVLGSASAGTAGVTVMVDTVIAAGMAMEGTDIAVAVVVSRGAQPLAVSAGPLVAAGTISLAGESIVHRALV